MGEQGSLAGLERGNGIIGKRNKQRSELISRRDVDSGVLRGHLMQVAEVSKEA